VKTDEARLRDLRRRIFEAAKIYNDHLRPERIPTYKLPAVFVHASLYRDPEHPFCVADVRQAWTELKGNPELMLRYLPDGDPTAQHALLPPADPNCRECRGTGMRRGSVVCTSCRTCPNCFNSRLEIFEVEAGQTAARRCGRCCPPLPPEEFG